MIFTGKLTGKLPV